MTEINKNSPMTNSTIELNQVVFENVHDQYVKGKDVVAHFTILQDYNINTDEDQIGLLRVGSTNIHECLAYARVQLNVITTEGSTKSGTAVFSSSCLPTTDDEFYQFCYIKNNRKYLGSSIPFQLNCSIDDLDLLTQSLTENTKIRTSNDSLIALNDNDNDELVVIHTKSTLVEEKLRQENRQLLDVNRRLEQQKDEYKIKMDLLDMKANEYIKKIANEMQLLEAKHKSTIDELAARQRLESKLRTDYDACCSLTNQYKTEALQFAEHCRTLEESNVKLSNEIDKLRSDLSNSTKTNEDSLKHINELETHLIQSNESLKSANMYQVETENKLRAFRLTAEKYQLTMQAQLDAYNKQASQQENQIHALETANDLLKDELKSIKSENQNLVKTNEQKQIELEVLRKELLELKDNQNAYMALKSSFNEIEKRCVKHQKGEIDAKKQLITQQEHINDLETKNQELTERLVAGADEYKNLYRKYIAIERMAVKANSQNPIVPKQNPTTLSNETGLNEEALVNLLRNSYELQQKDQEIEKEEEQDASILDSDDIEETVTMNGSVKCEEIQECPMCYWEFPKHLTLDQKKDHIENHFV